MLSIPRFSPIAATSSERIESASLWRASLTNDVWLARSVVDVSPLIDANTADARSTDETEATLRFDAVLFEIVRQSR